MVIWIKDSGTGRGIWVSNHHLRDSGFSFVLLLLPCPSLALGPLLTLILWSLRPLASWFIMDSLCQRIIEIPLVLFLPLRASWSKAWSSISWWFFSSSLQFTCGLRNSHVSSIVVRRRTRQGTTVLDCLRVVRFGGGGHFHTRSPSSLSAASSPSSPVLVPSAPWPLPRSLLPSWLGLHPGSSACDDQTDDDCNNDNLGDTDTEYDCTDFWWSLSTMHCNTMVRGAPKQIFGKSWEFGPRRGRGGSHPIPLKGVMSKGISELLFPQTCASLKVGVIRCQAESERLTGRWERWWSSRWLCCI